ncbi:uncharacterized protein LOC108023684 [Drosophila biarmipes]|uniref:uncharacterized protein LOC108023684 n=1 Tax=Drosophila biarmipes TaxID=125945 RepID=UPI0007E66DA3|nr:uncharacterized protein LOC108023684 [Drosophila biarmipes]
MARYSRINNIPNLRYMDREVRRAAEILRPFENHLHAIQEEEEPAVEVAPLRSRGSQVNAADLQQQGARAGGDATASGLQSRARRENKRLAPFTCNECHQYVRGGVITICGHLFCWTCLWPKVAEIRFPRCPLCRRRLVLYEDIVPFHGEGPQAAEADNDVLAEPGAVPRPTGLYLCDAKIPNWFVVDDPKDTPRPAFDQHTKERDLCSVVMRLPLEHPCFAAQLRFLQWFQVGCAIVACLMWCIFSLASGPSALFMP